MQNWWPTRLSSYISDLTRIPDDTIELRKLHLFAIDYSCVRVLCFEKLNKSINK